MESKINLTFLNGTGYIFNVNDYMKLRMEHHVVGAMVGVSSLRGWSANACNIPVELTMYETQLLVEKGIAVLLSKFSSLLREPTQLDLQSHKDESESRLLEQEMHWKKEKMKESLKNINKIMQGKRKKMLQSGVPEQDIKLSEEDVIQEMKENVSFDIKNVAIETHCEHLRTHEGLVVSPACYNPLKYRVYKHFWEQGKYITNGEMFGADFIVYPGDPMLFHASHIIIVLEENILNPLKLIAKVRLSVIVNKLCVFAYLDKNNELCYQTVKWECSTSG